MWRVKQTVKWIRLYERPIQSAMEAQKWAWRPPERRDQTGPSRMSRYTRGKEDGKDIPDRGNRRHKDSRYEKACQPSGKGSRVGTQRVRVAALFYLGLYFSNETAKSPEEDMKRKKKKKKECWKATEDTNTYYTSSPTIPWILPYTQTPLPPHTQPWQLCERKKSLPL